jgi:group I intron endonuclease
MADNAGIYEIVNTTNGYRYIGSSRAIRKRWGMHRCPHLQASWNKHGEGAFAFRVLLICDRTDLIAYEQAAIDGLRPEYNVAPKASLPNGVPMSPAGRERLSQRMRGNTNTLGLKHSPESRELIRRAKMGNTATRGRKLSPEHVAKVAAAHRGSKRSAESRARMSAAMAGKKHPPRSAAWSANLSAALMGKPKSPESIEKMKTTKRRLFLERKLGAA